ncbi:MAG: hypothetical protein ABI675_03050 [Chitinophagaceae bacterium]
MQRKITEEMVVENLLSEFPIKEREDLRQNNALVATLLNGEKRLINLEKTIVPVEVVGRYHVVEHIFPDPEILSAGHSAHPISFYDNYEQARKAYSDKTEDAIKNASHEKVVREIKLVGEFKGQILRLDNLGMPETQTGIDLGSTFTKLTKNEEKRHGIKETVDPTVPITVNQLLYVALKRDTARLQFEHRLFPSVELNVEFWKIDPEKNISQKQQKGPGDDDPLLRKRKGQDMSTELWIPDPVLSKRSGSNGKGIH